MSVDAVGSAGFTGWSDERGILVSGSLFDGPIWQPAAHGAGADCYQDSRITRPGTGEVRVFVSSDDWSVDKPVAGDGAITLAVYGMQAQSVAEIRWGKQQNLPEYCFYARNAGD